MTIKLGFRGFLGVCVSCSVLSGEVCFFRVLRHAADSWSCDQTWPSYKNASAPVVTESEKG